MRLFNVFINILTFLENNLPKKWYKLISVILIKTRNIFTFNFKYKCPCCKNNIEQFLKSSRWPWIEICPFCGSHNRHRLLWLLLIENKSLFKKRKFYITNKSKVLHIAPFPVLKEKLKTLKKIHYITADLSMPDVMIKMDITNIKLKSNIFNIIICSHVLEHVEEDRKALKELYRILKQGGLAIIIVPINKSLKKTYENPLITSPEERLKHFGQEDHVRWYGLDFIERLIQANFKVELFIPKNEFTEKQILKFGLDRNEIIYLCFKK